MLNLWPAIVCSKPSEKLSVIRLMENIVETVHKHFPTITISLQVSITVHQLSVQSPAVVILLLLFVPTDTRSVPWRSSQALEVRSSSLLPSRVRRGGCCWLTAAGRQEPLQFRSVPSSAELPNWCHGAWKLVSRWKMPFCKFYTHITFQMLNRFWIATVLFCCISMWKVFCSYLCAGSSYGTLWSGVGTMALNVVSCGHQIPLFTDEPKPNTGIHSLSLLLQKCTCGPCVAPVQSLTDFFGYCIERYVIFLLFSFLFCRAVMFCITMCKLPVTKRVLCWRQINKCWRKAKSTRHHVVACLKPMWRLWADTYCYRHWRYHAMALSFLRDLVHPDLAYPARIVRYFLHTLIHDSLELRKVWN